MVGLRQATRGSSEPYDFTPAELVAGMQALQYRVLHADWGSTTQAAQLNAVADSLRAALGGGAFIPFGPSA